MNLKELYQEIILDHGKNPHNLKKIENFNKDAKGYNPLCGDKVHVYLKLDNEKNINDISSTFLCSFNFKYTCTISPHKGLFPLASLVKFSVFLKFLGFLPCSKIIS